MVRLNEFTMLFFVFKLFLFIKFILRVFFSKKMLIEPRLVVSKFNFKIEFNFSASSVQAR